MKMRTKTTMALLGAVLMAGMSMAGTFFDDFNRENTPTPNGTTNGTEIGEGYIIVGNRFQIWENNLQFKGPDYGNNYIYNTNAVTGTSGTNDFSLSMDLIPNLQADVSGAGAHLGVVFNVQPNDEKSCYYLRIGQDYWQFVHNIGGSDEGAFGDGALSQDLELGEEYTITVSSTAVEYQFDFSIVRKSDAAVLASGTSAVAGAEFLDGYGGAYYFATLWESRADNFTVISSAIDPGPSVYEQWTIDQGLTAGVNDAPADNPDGIGGSLLNNLYEFGLGGDPLDASDEGLVPTHDVVNVDGTNWFAYVYPKLSDPSSGLNYYLELTESLVAPAWTNAGYFPAGVSTFAPGYDAITNAVPTDAGETFVRLVIEAQ